MAMTDSEALKKKIANAKPTSWLTDGLTKEEIEEALVEGRREREHLTPWNKPLSL